MFAGLYPLTGALWVPMVLHAGVDVAAGLTARLVHREPDVVDGAESESASPR